MQIDIYLREKKGENKRGFVTWGRGMRVPILPEEIKFESGSATFISYDIMKRGEVAIPTGTDLSAFSWKSEFPGELRKDSSMIRGLMWNDPKVYHKMLEEWKTNGTKINIMVTGYPINTDVYVESYKGAAAGPFGDITYEIKLVEARDITIPNMQKLSIPAKRAAVKSSSYTIKTGDTLWGISKKFYGTGTMWKKIYDANKNIIEQTAKSRWKAAGINRDSQNGHWIFPGVKITIPDVGG